MRVLCIMNQNIFDIKSGGGQCAKRNYDSIKESMKEGDLFYSCIISPEFKKVEEKSYEIYIPGLTGNVQSAIAALQGCKCCKKSYEKNIWNFFDRVKPDVVYMDTSKLGNLSRKIKKRYKSKIICFFHNVESDYSLNLVKNRGCQYLLSYLASLKNEKDTIKYADTIICLTQRDSDRIHELYGRYADIIVPISFKDKFEQSRNKIDDRKGLLFIGSLFPPNLDGIKWFVDEVMSRLPELNLTIVGKDFEKKRNMLERNNVKVIGTAVDLADFYYTYPIVVMPIQYGAGMKVKTAEAMMYGKIIMATNEALEGYEVSNQNYIFRCNTADEFIQKIRMVTEEKINYQNGGSRKIFLANYEFEVTRKKFEQAIKG